jgi:hypothetical protein
MFGDIEGIGYVEYEMHRLTPRRRTSVARIATMVFLTGVFTAWYLLAFIL